MKLPSSLWCLALAGCAAPAERAPAPEWHIDSPVVTIGVEHGPSPNLELSRVSSATRLPNGEVAVGNSGTSEVRYFDRSGTYLRSSGRRGQGPGDFSGSPLYLSIRDNNVLMVYDVETLRLTSLDSTGQLLSSLQLPHPDTLPVSWMPHLYPNAYLISDESLATRSCTGALLRRLAADPTQLTPVLARVDQLGFLWTSSLPHRIGAPTSWQIYDLHGTLTAHATFPAGFTAFEITQHDILGLQEDSVGVERVVIRPLRRTTSLPLSCEPPPAVSAQTDSTMIGTLRQVANVVIYAQEGFFADYGTYSTNADSLVLPEGTDVAYVILSANERQWFGMLVNSRTRATCAIGVGYQPPGWKEGSARCVTGAS